MLKDLHKVNYLYANSPTENDNLTSITTVISHSTLNTIDRTGDGNKSSSTGAREEYTVHHSGKLLKQIYQF